MNQVPLITAVRVTGSLQLIITWSTRETLECNLATIISVHSAMAALADPIVFSQVVIDEWGHGLDWPGGLDMGANRLYQLCREQAGLFSQTTA